MSQERTIRYLGKEHFIISEIVPREDEPGSIIITAVHADNTGVDVLQVAARYVEKNDYLDLMYSSIYLGDSMLEKIIQQWFVGPGFHNVLDELAVAKECLSL